MTPIQVRPTAHPIHILLLYLAVAILLPAVPANAAVFTVGAGIDCDFHDLQGAILAMWLNDTAGPTEDELRIVRDQTYVGEYFIDHQALTLTGGFDSCSDPEPSGHTTIYRRPHDRQLTISDISDVDLAEPRVTLTNLLLTYDGEPDSPVHYGGSIYVENSRVDLSNTIVERGNAYYGGGIFSHRKVFLRLDENTEVRKNDAVFGGGLACTDVGQEGEDSAGFLYLRNATVHDNRARLGGGALVQRCLINLDAEDTSYGVLNNTAERDGGGIYAIAEATVRHEGGAIADNVAQHGGGVFLLLNSSLSAYGQPVYVNNQAEFDGGAVYAENSWVTVLGGEPGYRCSFEELSKCSTFTGNRAGDRGGALYLSDSMTRIERSRFTDNEAGRAAIAFLTRSTENEDPYWFPDLNLESTEIFGNRGDVMIDATGMTSFRGRQLTVAKNRPTTPGASWTFVESTEQAYLQNSIFSDDTGQIHNSSSAPPTNWQCLLLTSPTLDPNGVEIYVGNPDFRDEPAEDYRLGLNSDAIDLCNFAGTNLDRISEIFGLPHPSSPPGSPTVDAGAFELAP